MDLAFDALSQLEENEDLAHFMRSEDVDLLLKVPDISVAVEQELGQPSQGQKEDKDEEEEEVQIVHEEEGAGGRPGTTTGSRG